jgi:hypothetical protein
MITSPQLTRLCQYAIEHGFKNLNRKEIPINAGTSIWASHNGAGSISLKLYANRSLVYSDQFSMYDKDFARALFGDGERRTYLLVDQKTRMLTRDAEGVTFAYEWAYRIAMAVLQDDAIEYYHKKVFHG